MFRFICIVIFLVSFLILSIPVFFVEWVIGKFNREKRDYSSLRIVQWAFKVILKITGVKTTVIGEENVPDEPVLFIGNHRSFFDILLTYSRCRRLTGYVAKKRWSTFHCFPHGCAICTACSLTARTRRKDLRPSCRQLIMSKKESPSVSSQKEHVIKGRN